MSASMCHHANRQQDGKDNDDGTRDYKICQISILIFYTIYGTQYSSNILYKHLFLYMSVYIYIYIYKYVCIISITTVAKQSIRRND